MTNVYVVTSGDYSDYSIDAIFSSRKLAQSWIDLKKQEEFASNFSIEKWGVDSESGAKLIRVWSCGIFMDDGRIVEGPSSRDEVRVPFRGLVKQLAVSIPCYQGRKVTRVESAASANHAVKLAAETRQAWLREKASTGNKEAV